MGKELGNQSTYTLEEKNELIENLPSKDNLKLIDRIGSNQQKLV
jgi:hypothetical protein